MLLKKNLLDLILDLRLKLLKEELLQGMVPEVIVLEVELLLLDLLLELEEDALLLLDLTNPKRLRLAQVNINHSYNCECWQQESSSY